ncbi:MAG: class IV adenylate cyclase [Chloroflexi bacterium]|nr:class IV adenylate cyclase [Chloroflexota bacterium]
MAKECEVKFFLTDVKNIQKHLLAAGAEIIKPRVFERNLRFDFPDRSLTAAGKVLRLRQDSQVRLTYKDRACNEDMISEREELEIQVDDFDTAQALLSALGYEVSVQYEKYRTTYQLHDVEIDLDEMPFGNFLEIEGPGAVCIQKTAEQLELNWEARSTMSYIGLFEKLRSDGLEADQLTFDQFKEKTFTAENFGLIPAENEM